MELQQKPDLGKNHSASGAAYEGADFFKVSDWKGMLVCVIGRLLFRYKKRPVQFLSSKVEKVVSCDKYSF